MILSIENKFFGSKIKVERAQDHIREFENKLVDYIKSKPFKLVVEQDKNSNNHLWTLRINREVPYQYAAIIGDIIHNLRSSLDLLASELVMLSGENTKNVYFPFANNEDSLDEMIIARNLNRAGEDVVNLVKSLKPYKGGNELLRALHDLDITDKHRSIIPVVYYAGIKNFQMFNTAGPIITINDLRCGPIKDGMVLMRLPPARNVKVGQSFPPILKLKFNNEVFQSNEDLIEILNNLVVLVQDILHLFESHFNENK